MLEYSFLFEQFEDQFEGLSKELKMFKVQRYEKPQDFIKGQKMSNKDFCHCHKIGGTIIGQSKSGVSHF